MTYVAWLFLAVLGSEPPRAVHFDTEIIPVLTKAGCNAGACHGAAAGRGGFHLSLLGADAGADYDTIVHALEGRRINLASPEASLLLRKPTGQLDHGGDVVLSDGGAGAEQILAWIRTGARRNAPRRLTHFDIEPHRLLCQEVPASVPLKVTARFDDGPREDVTPWTVFVPSDPAAVQIGDDHVVRISRRGQHVVIARFLDRVVPLQFNVPLSDTETNLANAPRAGFIDQQVLQLLSDLRLPISPAASDAVWLRRVSLDLTGRLPEPDLVESFVADVSTDKRIRLVDSLLTSEAFADYWTLRFSKLLRLHSLPNEHEGLHAYVNWLRQQIVADTGLDEVARQLLTATGDSHAVGPANFGRMVGDARSHAELVGQFFLGMRLGCANCHNHPLDKWTQDDYHGLAAVFARMERGRQVELLSRGAVTNLRTNEPAVPRIPAVRYLPVDGDHRQQVFEWITSGEQHYFARATVNRLWRAMFGRGLVEPTDDLRETNPATHPELLALLAADFAESGYHIRHTLKQIALSHTYSRSDATLPGNELDDRFYSHAYSRPLDPEVLVDAIADVTGVPEEFGGQEPSRAVAIIDPLSPAPVLDILGRCNRVAGCDDASTTAVGLPAQLHLLNGSLVNAKLTSDHGRLHQLIAVGKSDDEIVSEFFLRGLGRRPTNEESQRWRDRLGDQTPEERTWRLEDFVWSMLSSRSFLENH